MAAKLRIKAKGIEIDWEGDVQFLKSELPDVIASIVEAIGYSTSDHDKDDGNTGAANSSLVTNKFTTASIAAKMQPGSGPELFKVALAKIQISDGVEPAPRAQIHNEMKNAPKFYKPSMRGNLGKMIDSLLASGEINEPSKGVFALSQATHEAILQRLNQ
jgi:hypothetical protein